MSILPISALSLGAILAIALPATLVSAAPALQPLSMAKECSAYTGGVPSYCTITTSNIAAIPSGTKVFYYGPLNNGPGFTSQAVVIAAGEGNTAVGYCMVDQRGAPHGMCSFWGGSGSLAGFAAILDVTVDTKQMWHWEGGYQLGPTQ